ncbi:MAG: DUF559 domain-containing protein [Chitinophagales bacterium]|nr:DUF559 domain-containing protein [Chitinophagales bacterium]
MLGKAYFFIADFYCAEKSLIIEVDGKYYDFQKDYDANRDAVLASLSLTTVRLSNEELKNMNAVKEKIGRYLK